ncbi:MAG: hypothetical protein ABIW16_01575, partial [Sphingomicrobium sp.]
TQPHEAVLLKLDCSKARSELGWSPKLRLKDALAMVVAWHRDVARGDDALEVSRAQLADYINRNPESQRPMQRVAT